MTITYEKFDDYFVFSHKPNTRVYLGDANTEDYLWDEEQQVLRSASCWYKEVHTGKEITWDDIRNYGHDGSKPGNGFVWYGESSHSLDKRENYTFEGGHTHNFTRRIQGMCSMGNLTTGRGCEYRQSDKVVKRLAESWYWGMTLEEYDAREEKYRKQHEEQARKRPWLHNLMWVSGKMYYVDDAGKEITSDQHVANMKAKFGDDVFELAAKEETCNQSAT